MREVAEGKLAPTKKFESITFGEIPDFCWERHGKNKRGFQYKIHRLEKFKRIKARKLLPEMIDDFLKELLEVEEYPSPTSTITGRERLRIARSHYLGCLNGTS